MKRIYSFFIVLFILIALPLYAFFFSPKKKDYVRINLSTYSWKFGEKGKPLKYIAEIPGTVQTDLVKNGVIDAPYFRDNEKKYAWIGEKEWEYSTEFFISEDILKKENLELIFKGLDTYAYVFLNDKLLLKANNFFREWSLSIKEYVKIGKNRLRIIFKSPLKIIKKKKPNYYNGKTTADYIFVRKPAYHFGWDWAPVYITMGVWRPVYLIAWSELKLIDVRVIQQKVSKEQADLKFVFEIVSTKEQNIKIELNSNNTDEKLTTKVKLFKGKNKVSLDFKIKNPRLWWPRDLGEAYLYSFSAKVFKGRKIKGDWMGRIGIRTVKLVRKKDSLGESFYFKVNGIPLYIKGANYIPQDMFIPQVKKEKYEKLFFNIRKSNINMLRVWGGGFYENELFYELCDKYGILVWQDFMFACALYPGNENFLENVKKEAIYNIKRLRNHPSIALWCGNNEIYEGWENWGWKKMYSPQEQRAIEKDYKNLFLKLLPELVKKYDGKRDYIHTSPLTNWGKDRLNTKGDVHYWGVWHGREFFETFTIRKKIGRFVSEFGFQAYPPLKTIKEFTLPEERRIGSKILKAHEKHPIGFKIINEYMKEYFGIPEILEDYIYVSQLLQAYGMGIGIEAYRRAKPSCMGSLYWQLNDCWPAISWSGMDWKGRWKAFQYTVKRLYSDILISPTIENKKLRIYIISDKLNSVRGKLSFELKDFEGNTLSSYSDNVSLSPMKSKVYFEKPVSEIIKEKGKDSIFLYITLKDKKDKIISERYFYFVKPKELKLKKPEIRLSVKKSSAGYKFEIISNRLAKNIFLSFENYKGFFNDIFLICFLQRKKV